MYEGRAKYAVRVIAAISALTIGLLSFLNVLMALTEIEPDAIEGLQRSNVIVGVLASLLGLIGPISVMGLWFLMLYHWGTHKFKSAGQKKLWLVLLILGNVVVALVYYFVVYEARRTLQVCNAGRDERT